MGAMNDFPVSVRFPIHWADMDAYGHVNNARHLTWFEAARIDYMIRVGLVKPDMGQLDSGVGPILATASVDYLRPVVFPAELEVGVRVSRIGTTSITMEYAVVDARSGVHYARGRTVLVVLRYTDHAKLPVPAQMRAAIEALEGRAFPPA